MYIASSGKILFIIIVVEAVVTVAARTSTRPHKLVVHEQPSVKRPKFQNGHYFYVRYRWGRQEKKSPNFYATRTILRFYVNYVDLCGEKKSKLETVLAVYGAGHRILFVASNFSCAAAGAAIVAVLPLVRCLENRIHQTHHYQGRHGDFIDGLGKFHAQTLLLAISVRVFFLRFFFQESVSVSHPTFEIEKRAPTNQ